MEQLSLPAAASRRLSAPALDFAAVREEFALPGQFPDDAAAEAAAARDRYAADREDRTDIPFVTIDPPDSLDLDQALHVERGDDGGFVVCYAIADVAAVVEPGGAIDSESRKRGQTVYLPDGTVPLHPRVLSEGAASLLPGQVRPALLWRIELDSDAEPLGFTLTRARVRSVAKLNYAGVQKDVNNEEAHPSIAALPEFGRLRAMAALRRGAIELKLPEQRVSNDSGRWQLVVEGRTEVDDWNAEVSLLTGICAGTLMLSAQQGLLRTLPPASADTVDVLRRAAAALSLRWHKDMSVGEFLAGLNPRHPATLAMMAEATKLLRGADYVSFDGLLPELQVHAGVASPYAHVTAPLRRLADRFALEVCLAAANNHAMPTWVRESLDVMPQLMRGSSGRANAVGNACVDLAEAVLLAPRVGQEFAATVLRAAESKRKAEIFIDTPAILARCTGSPPEGQTVRVRLTKADPATRTVEFSY